MIPNCVHQSKGLCPACQADYDEDPSAWLEFGQHTQGIENWKRLEAEIEAMRPELEEEANAPRDDSIPF